MCLWEWFKDWALIGATRFFFFFYKPLFVWSSKYYDIQSIFKGWENILFRDFFSIKSKGFVPKQGCQIQSSKATYHLMPKLMCYLSIIKYLKITSELKASKMMNDQNYMLDRDNSSWNQHIKRARVNAYDKPLKSL